VAPSHEGDSVTTPLPHASRRNNSRGPKDKPLQPFTPVGEAVLIEHAPTIYAWIGKSAELPVFCKGVYRRFRRQFMRQGIKVLNVMSSAFHSYCYKFYERVQIRASENKRWFGVINLGANMQSICRIGFIVTPTVMNCLVKKGGPRRCLTLHANSTRPATLHKDPNHFAWGARETR
jgi:hypothetical protein